MLLDPNKSECQLHQKEIVCKDKGERPEYRAINPNGIYEVRKYRLDGNLVLKQTCCDFLVINDTSKKSYYIELKGTDIKRAFEQVLAGEEICKSELKGYVSRYRIVTSKTPTHDNMPKVIRNFKDKYGSNCLKYQSQAMRETLD